MKKSIDDDIQEMLEQARNGTLKLKPCDEYISQRTPEERKKAVEELKRLNDITVYSAKSKKGAAKVAISKSSASNNVKTLRQRPAQVVRGT